MVIEQRGNGFPCSPACVTDNCDYAAMMPITAQAFPGMEWIPVMFLFIVGGWVVGLLAIALRPFAKFRTAGRRLSFAAIAIGIGSPLFFMCVVGNEVVPFAYVIFTTPALIGGIAILIYPRERIEGRGFAVLTEGDGDEKTG